MSAKKTLRRAMAAGVLGGVTLVFAAGVAGASAHHDMHMACEHPRGTIQHEVHQFLHSDDAVAQQVHRVLHDNPEAHKIVHSLLCGEM
ncbi:hypothetical protein ONR57_06540 [Hoyosella sp. YIM 151337]|uniref:hypothetical protein n=1 Tax=Hoyosella sp. YIM 151337 TaxID=2992742 RepID=UPI002235792B|nr:hypothetical protein [Hoyosella sp. YIM 151337]MCW4352950.1 hypothetical protein [Hoyosella sp. YIM 151337]